MLYQEAGYTLLFLIVCTAWAAPFACYGTACRLCSQGGWLWERCHTFGRSGVQVLATVNNLEDQVCKSLQVWQLWKIRCANPCNCAHFEKQLSATLKVRCANPCSWQHFWRSGVQNPLQLSSVLKIRYANPCNTFKFWRSGVQILAIVSNSEDPVCKTFAAVNNFEDQSCKVLEFI